MTTATRAEKRTKNSGAAGAFLAALAGLLCLTLSCILAYHHPLSPAWAAASVAVLVGLGVWQPRCVWWLPPALLPLIGLAPWTGWIVFEEFDLLLLALLAGAYARWMYSMRQTAAGVVADRNQSRRHRRSPQGAYALVALTVLLFATSVLISMFRGFDDAGGFSFGWFQGYHEPMNSLRLAKPFFLALLWWPLWRAAQRTSPEASNEALGLGLLLGMATVGLVALWERLAFTGLLNFSTDYRTTALFWEMHVGGAALDGFLALTVPFVLRELMLARSSRQWMLAAGVMLLAAYVSLTTFSRGVYLAVPLGLGLTAWLHTRQINHPSREGGKDGPLGKDDNRSETESPRGRLSWRSSACWVLLFMALSTWMFPTSGYRGMLALLGSVGLLMLLLPRLLLLGPAHWASVCFGGAFLSACAWGVAWFVPKGAYIAYALVATGTAMAVASGYFRPSQPPTTRSNITAAIGLLATWAAMLAVAMHWGGNEAAKRAAAVAVGLCVLMLVWVLLRGRKKIQSDPPTTSWRGQLAVLGAMAISGALVAVFAGGAYMGERFSTGGKDFGGRLLHWQIGINALNGPWDWALGKGQGRYPASHFNSGLVEDQTGDYRLRQDPAGNHYLAMSGGKHILGWGEMFRISQRVTAPLGTTQVQFDARVKTPVTLHFEVCEKHLLYNNACLIQKVEVKPAASGSPAWQSLSAVLDGERNPSTGPRWAPKLIMFSVGVYTNGAVAEVDNLKLLDSTGANLLRNSDFSLDMAQWFFTSDRHHMPWHIKSVFMHVFFDQGWVGLLLWLALSAGALWRVTLGSGRQHSLSPAIAGSLLGFAVVGLFDSLLDVPRLATLYYLLVLVALVLRPSHVNHGVSR
ncbi:MAG: hypothetical protein HEQ39_03690 [Rhizobacter sp.]